MIQILVLDTVTPTLPVEFFPWCFGPSGHFVTKREAALFPPRHVHRLLLKVWLQVLGKSWGGFVLALTIFVLKWFPRKMGKEFLSFQSAGPGG